MRHARGLSSRSPTTTSDERRTSKWRPDNDGRMPVATRGRGRWAAWLPVSGCDWPVKESKRMHGSCLIREESTLSPSSSSQALNDGRVADGRVFGCRLDDTQQPVRPGFSQSTSRQACSRRPALFLRCVCGQARGGAAIFSGAAACVLDSAIGDGARKQESKHGPGTHTCRCIQ